MAPVEVTAQQLWRFGTYLNTEVRNDFDRIVRDQAGWQACNTDGFTGLITPLRDSLTWLHDRTDHLLDTAITRLEGVSGSLIASAYSYAGMDNHNREVLEDVPDNKHRPTPTGPGPGITFTTEGSSYHNPTPITAKPISPEGRTITEIMEGHTRRDAEAVNWIVRNFSEQLGLGGKDLRQLVIEPLSGDFNRIRADGEAWGDVATMLNTVLNNLSKNAGRLVTSGWTGDAAQAFLEHIDVIWTGGIYIASKCAEWLQKGFDKLADLVSKIARKCAEIFDRLIGKIIAVARRFIPGLGQALIAFEWIASGFQEFPAWDDIEDIAQMVGEIKRLHETIANLVTAAQSYIDAFQAAVEAVKKIPQVGSINDAATTAGEFREGTDQMRQAREEFDKNAGGLQKQLDYMSTHEPQ